MPDRFRRLALLFVVVACLAAAPASPADFDQAGYDMAVRTILCDCGCHPQSVHDCACGRAAEMRDEIRGMIEQGLSGEAVVARYVAEHGEKIRIAPTADGFNLVAWLGPFVGLLAAMGLVGFSLLRWSRRPATAAPVAAPAPGPAADDPYVQRLRRELEES